MDNLKLSTSTQPSAFKAAISGSCPVCRQGAFFSHPWYSPKFTENNRYCPVCHTDFEPEPGFLYGAMYVSYSLNVATLATVSLLIYVLFNPESPFWYIGGVVGTTLLGLPFIWRTSRIIWIYLFGPFAYDPQAATPNHLDFQKETGRR